MACQGEGNGKRGSWGGRPGPNACYPLHAAHLQGVLLHLLARHLVLFLQTQ